MRSRPISPRDDARVNGGASDAGKGLDLAVPKLDLRLSLDPGNIDAVDDYPLAGGELEVVLEPRIEMSLSDVECDACHEESIHDGFRAFFSWGLPRIYLRCRCHVIGY